RPVRHLRPPSKMVTRDVAATDQGPTHAERHFRPPRPPRGRAWIAIEEARAHHSVVRLVSGTFVTVAVVVRPAHNESDYGAWTGGRPAPFPRPSDASHTSVVPDVLRGRGRRGRRFIPRIPTVCPRPHP